MCIKLITLFIVVAYSYYLCLDKTLSSGLFKNQITILVIGIDPHPYDPSTMVNICNRIFTVFTNLTHLIFHDVSYENPVRLISVFLSSRFSSSTLLVLNIKLQTFAACLHILDGRFSQLHTLYVDLTKIYREEREIPNEVSVTRKEI